MVVVEVVVVVVVVHLGHQGQVNYNHQSENLDYIFSNSICVTRCSLLTKMSVITDCFKYSEYNYLTMFKCANVLLLKNLHHFLWMICKCR